MAGRIDKPECRRLRLEGWTLDRLAARYGVSRPAVCKACTGVVPSVEHRGGRVSEFHREATERAQHRRAEARLMWRLGADADEIGRVLNISIARVYDYTKGLPRNRHPWKRASHLPQIPAWVAASGLTEDFVDFAREFGEQRAARECRRLKAEAAGCC